MATQIEVVNRILRRLREDEVTSITETTYSQLIADMVADAYQEVVEEYDWRSLKHSVVVQIVALQDQYNLSDYTPAGGGTGDVDPVTTRLAKTDSYLEYEDFDRPNVFLENVDNNSIFRPIESTEDTMRRQRAINTTDIENDDAGSFSLSPNETNDGMILSLYPIPSAARQITLTFFTRPDRLISDGTDDDTFLLCPDRPVYQLAYAYALNERGEEIGEPGNVAEQRYTRALGAAIEAELQSQERANGKDWRRD